MNKLDPILILCPNLECVYNTQAKRRSIYKMSFCNNKHLAVSGNKTKGYFECLSFKQKI